MVRERGSGKTPERLVSLLSETKSLLALAKATGVGKSALSRYAKGIGEPTSATLQKLADHFGRPVSWLRGDVCAEENAQERYSYVCAECEKPMSVISTIKVEPGHTEVRLAPCEMCRKLAAKGGEKGQSTNRLQNPV